MVRRLAGPPKAGCDTLRDKVASASGFTLVELITVIAIAAIIIPSLLIPFIVGTRRGDRPEIHAAATYLVQERMELLKALSFDNLTPVGSWVNESPITLNGRTYNRSYLIQWADSSMQTDDADDPDDFDDNGNGINPSQTYKRITVTVSNSRISDVTAITARVNP
ncbi:MAG: prepilin-type N-terminal cleavage/methylation domain-containing protein [Candidatus Brocadiales bacterium]